MADKYTYTIGRRKTSVASVRLFENSGEHIVNEKPFSKFFVGEYYKDIVSKPFSVADLDFKKFMFTAKVNGGGINSQVEAISHAISRAIAKAMPEKKKLLKDAGLLTRDPRMVERKKPGLHKARKAEQYSKR